MAAKKNVGPKTGKKVRISALGPITRGGPTGKKPKNERTIARPKPSK